jgi:hypothetical protein
VVVADYSILISARVKLLCVLTPYSATIYVVAQVLSREDVEKLRCGEPKEGDSSSSGSGICSICLVDFGTFVSVFNS